MRYLMLLLHMLNMGVHVQIFAREVIWMVYVGPRPSFERTLVMFDHFWDFDRLVEDGAPRRSGDPRVSPILRVFWVLGFM
jgi:hypothetical protein